MKKICKLGFLWLCIGSCYMGMEVVWRLFSGSRIYPNVLYMLPIGGLCGLLVGSINQFKWFFHMRIVLQSFIGTLITLAVELMAGYLLNIHLGLNIWDYSNVPGNFMGQICVPFALLWFFIMPFAIWLEDKLRWGFWDEGYEYSLLSIYKDFFSLR